MSLLRAHGAVELERGQLEVELDVEAGEIVGLVGPNGAGKSATLLSVLGFHSFTRGSLSVEGAVLDDGEGSPTPVHRRGLGWVPQSPTLLPRRRVDRQVAAFARPDAPLARHGVTGLLDELGLSGVARHRPHQLSGGETQRVAVARALAAAKLVLLDEPTAAQDADGAQRTRALIGEHTTAGGAAVVVAHRPEDAYAFADRLVVLEAGAVVQSGTPAALAARPSTPYVAHVVGATVLHGEVGPDHVLRGDWGELYVPDDTSPGPAAAVVRPGTVVLHRTRPTGSSRNVVAGVIAAVNDTTAGVTVQVRARPDLVATLTHAAAAELAPRTGERIYASVKANDVAVTTSGRLPEHPA